MSLITINGGSTTNNNIYYQFINSCNILYF